MSLNMADLREIASTFNCTGTQGIEKRDDPSYNTDYLGTSAHKASFMFRHKTIQLICVSATPLLAISAPPLIPVHPLKRHTHTDRHARTHARTHSRTHTHTQVKESTSSSGREKARRSGGGGSAKAKGKGKEKA